MARFAVLAVHRVRARRVALVTGELTGQVGTGDTMVNERGGRYPVMGWEFSARADRVTLLFPLAADIEVDDVLVGPG
ncbi:hypothetical protein R8Z50_04930 [Longispora sp. K20-0274]|uniref:hypothetical protein n=1 Tax=Longispora sp. K20-0274 TaxID=3088255 RepID=UPI003999F474